MIDVKPCGNAAASCPAQHGKIVPSEPAVSRDAAGRTRLMIVGEGPGRTELEKLRPFIGASGKMLARGLRTIDLNRGSIHWTNAVLCDCKPHLLPKARKACERRLQNEIAAASPVVIGTVGAMGLQSVLRSGKKPQVLKWRGSVSKIQLSEMPVEAQKPAAKVAQLDQRDHGSAVQPSGISILLAPTIHPAFVMRSPGWAPILERDVARWGRLIESGFVAPENAPGRVTIFARTEDQLLSALARWPYGVAVSFDVETVGLGPTSTALVCFGMSDGKTTIVVPWTKDQGGKIPHWRDPESIARLVNDRLRGRSVVMHNGAAFDVIVAARYGLSFPIWEDTLLASHATASHLKKGLDHVVQTYLDVPPWKQWPHAESLEQLWGYNARDALYTILAWHAKRGELRA